MNSPTQFDCSSNEEYFNALAQGTPEELLEGRIRGIVAAWVPRLGLSHHNITLEFKGEKTDDTLVARCKPLWQYLDSTIAFFLPACADLTENRLEYVVIHELVHVIVAEMKQNPGETDHEERVVSHIAMTLQKLSQQSKCG